MMGKKKWEYERKGNLEENGNFLYMLTLMSLVCPSIGPINQVKKKICQGKRPGWKIFKEQIDVF